MKWSKWSRPNKPRLLDQVQPSMCCSRGHGPQGSRRGSGRFPIFQPRYYRSALTFHEKAPKELVKKTSPVVVLAVTHQRGAEEPPAGRVDEVRRRCTWRRGEDYHTPRRQKHAKVTKVRRCWHVGLFRAQSCWNADGILWVFSDVYSDVNIFFPLLCAEEKETRFSNMIHNRVFSRLILVFLRVSLQISLKPQEGTKINEIQERQTTNQ